MKCAHCGVEFHAKQNYVNRAQREGRRMFCSRVCFGLDRRLVNPPTEAERKEAKRLYDAARRAERHAEICAKKRDHYYANRDRILAEQTAYRKAHMQRHVEYCRQPEYKAWKSEYDRQYRAHRDYGEFADAFLLLTNIEREVDSRATRYEIYQANGTLNKSQTRRRAL
jgi:hypothetical protein